MPRKPKPQTHIPGFGFIYQPRYTYKGELRTSNVWWMEYNTLDQPVRRTTGQRDQESAYSELMKAAGDRASWKIMDSAPEKIRIGYLLDLLLEHYEQKATLYDLKCRVEKHIRPKWDSVRAVELRTADLEIWVKYLRKTLSAASINRCLANLHKALKIGLRRDLVLRIPEFPWQTESNERQGTLSRNQYEAMRDNLASHARLALVIGYHVGLRRGVILGLRWEWIDFAANVIRIPNTDKETKKKPRSVPIYGEMRGYLEMAKAERDTDFPSCPWVVNLDGRRIADLKTAWQAARRRSGVNAALFHDLRRTAATNMHAAGISETDIMRVCGWKTPTMLRRYIQQTESQTRSVGGQMERWLADQVPEERESKKPN